MGMALAAVVALAGCGDDDENGDTRPEATSANTIYDASPAAGVPGRGGLPQDAETAEVTIKDGKFDPDNLEGQVGLAYVLTVTGDGTPHRLVIEGLVAGQDIAATGDTLVQFTVAEGGEGTKAITLDGNEAGTFRVQGAGGVVP